MSGRALRLDDHSLRHLIVGTGLGWSIAFPVVALFFQLQLYGDGAMFSYAVAVRDVWAFHWHNVSGRTSVFLLTLLPAEALVQITGSPSAGIIAYGLLFYISPLIGLAVTYAADHSPGRIIFVYACASTALLCPLIFGFPTEMWLAHALFWPTLAVSHYAKTTKAGALLVFSTWLLLSFTHEGALVLLLAITATLAPRGLRSATFLRAAVSLMIIAALAAAAKIAFPPDDYYADAFVRAALHFFALEIFEVRIVLVLLAAVVAYGTIFMLLSKWLPRQACVCALGILLGSLTVYWLHFDHSLHADSRYYLRTALVLGIPLLGTLAAMTAMINEGIDLKALASFGHSVISLRGGSSCALASIFIMVTVIHVVETGKFVTSWAQLPQCRGSSGDERSIRRRAWRPALCLGRADSASACTAVMVFDRPLSFDYSFEFLSEPTRHRSRRKLLLAILPYSDEKQGCSACRAGADARIGPGLFLPASITEAVAHDAK